jgi:hypothetical protein
MNDALRRAIARICLKFDSIEEIAQEEINHISLELKRITGHDLDEEAHNLFMMFHYKHAQYGELRGKIQTIHRLEPSHYVTCGMDEYFGTSSGTLLSKIGLFSQTVINPDPDSAPQVLHVSDLKKSYS